MWPFRKKNNEVDPKYKEFLELQERIFSNYPLYSHFEYLGVDCRVTKHQRHYPKLRGTHLLISVVPAGVDCDYVDKNGVIHDRVFDFKELEALVQDEHEA